MGERDNGREGGREREWEGEREWERERERERECRRNAVRAFRIVKEVNGWTAIVVTVPDGAIWTRRKGRYGQTLSTGSAVSLKGILSLILTKVASHFLKAQRVELNDFKLYSGSGTLANVTDRSIGHP